MTERNVSLFEQGRLDELAEDLTLKGDIPLAIDPSLFPRDAALQRVYSELRKHIKAANPVGSFYFWSRTRRDIGSSAFGIVGGDGREVITPFLDRKLWTLLAGLPARMLLSRTFHTDTIARSFPEAAKLPYAGEGRRFPLSHTMSQVGNFIQWIYSRRSFGSLLDVRKTRLLALRTLAPARSSDILWLRPFSVYLSTV
jgi:asparagine synthase (glutamine-hydrolysing)